MKRSKFSLSNTKLLSCDMGELVPIGLQEVLPGDTFQHSTSALIRVAPLLAPVMHRVDVRIHHFFVPHRLVWEDWEDFITGGSDGEDASVFPTITLNTTTGTTGTLADYLGVPLVASGTLEVSALPFRGVAKIYNEFYRDQDLVTPLVIDMTSGPDTTTSTTLQNIAWEKDYFTSARPWTQKGPEITLPITGDAPIRGLGMTDGGTISTTDRVVRETPPDGQATQPDTVTYLNTVSSSSAVWYFDMTGAGPSDAASHLNVYADLSEVSGVDVNDLRLAFALQRYEEARARYGSRYTEYLRYLGVKSSDARLQRPEYLGGGKQTIQFSEVLATAETGATTDVGDMKGHGIAALRSNRYRRFFEEHGYVFTLLSVKPKTIYMQGLPRTWNRRTKEDFWQQELQHVGQQEVLNKELYAAHTTPDGVFGYQDRYDEYRRSESMVAGEFRTSLLNFWHYARSFTSDPALNSTFVTSVPTKRVNAVTTQDVLYVMANHSIQARRMVAKTGTSFIF